jgi:serine phosphatase RsbU (regulator of sigma subunit)
LRQLLESFTGDSVEKLGDAIRDGMKAFTEGAPQSDDITILIIQYKGNL